VGHVQLVGRSGKAQVTGRGLKARQRIQGRETARHGAKIDL
jgi:hypothetical protein